MSSIGQGYAFGQVLSWDHVQKAYKWLPGSSPSSGQVLSWDGTTLAWVTPSSGGSVSGDLSGTVPGTITVVGIRGRAVATTTPTTGFFYRWSGSQWEPRGPLFDIATNAVVTANSNKLPVGVVGTASGQVLTWNGTTWAAAVPFTAENDLQKGIATDSTGVATVIGAAYINTSSWPTSRTVKFRCILESTNSLSDYAATADLFDTDSNLGVTPSPVIGSQVNNAGVLNPLVASVVEANITTQFSGFTGAGVFEARLWIATPGGGNIVTCKSAQIIVE